MAVAWPDAYETLRSESLGMTALFGWELVLRCKACGRDKAWSSEQLLDDFGPALGLTLAIVADRARCASCGGRGAWVGHRAGIEPWVLEGGRDSGLKLWQAWDVHLRRRLHARSLPLEIADDCWAQLKAYAGAHHDWAPRAWPVEGAPLSEAGQAALGRQGFRPCATPTT